MKNRLRTWNRQKSSVAIAYAVTVYAFVNSYLHGVAWAQKHSTHEGGAQNFAWGNAAIPELILIAVLTRGRFDWKAAIGAAMSVSWTLWVNGAAAAPGGSGMVVALSAPIAALYCAWLTDHGSGSKAQDESPAQSVAQTEAQAPAQPVVSPEPEEAQAQPVVAQPEAQAPAAEPEPVREPEKAQAQPVEKAHIVIEPSAAQNVTRLSDRPKAQAPKAKRGAFADGVKWLSELGPAAQEKKAQQIADELGVSLATAKRIRTEVFGPVRAQKTDKTA